MDDTSITVRKNKKDLIIDSGLYNYDVNNSTRRLINSQRAHSGVFFEELDNMTRTEFSRKYKDKRAVLKQTGESSYIGIKAFATSYISREIDLSSDKIFSLQDTFISDEHKSVVQRFIVPLDAVIEIRNGSVEITNTGEKVIIFFEYPFEAIIKTSENSDRGLASPGFNKLSKTQCLEINPLSSAKHLTFKILM